MDKNQFDELIKNKNDGKKIDEFINSNLSADQKNKLGEILSDKEKLKSLLSSEKAREILNRLKKD